MAFPIPAHLPRKNDTRDVSTQVLSKISQTPSKLLNAQLAASWLAELDDTITLTKTRIHERISNDLPNFNRQHATSVSVQQRLLSLANNVDILRGDISDPESGLIPRLVGVLSKHATLAQDASDARVRHVVLAHLLHCRRELQRLTRLVEKAELAEATKACASLVTLIADAPEPLLHSEIMADIKRKTTTMRNRTEEQLLDAYSRSIVVSASEISIKPSVQAVLPRRLTIGQWVPSVNPSDNIDTAIDLSALLASLAPSVLSMHLSTLRRDITTHCIDYTLKQPVEIYETTSHDIIGTMEHKLSFQRAPPGTDNLTTRISHLATVMTFLNDNLFPHFPLAERKSFPLSLCTPIRTGLLDHLLLPNLPSSLSKLSEFLELAERAVQAEDEIVAEMFGDNSEDQRVKSWVDGVGLHYERKRRADILNKARLIAVSAHDESRTFRVDVPFVIEDRSTSIQVEDTPVSTNGGTNGHTAPADDAWGFDETPTQSEESLADDWGFDDEADPEPALEPEPEPPALSPPDSATTATEQEDEGPGDAWDWNDDSSPTAVEDESAWDDAWDEKPVAPVSPSPAPKPAKGLEKKFTSKSVPPSPALPPPSPAQLPPVVVPAVSSQAPAPHSPPPPKSAQVTESYVVSGRTKELLQLVDDVLREGTDLVASGLLAAHTHSGSPGNVLMQAAPMALELFRALVPPTLTQSAKEHMRFSNDCMYVGQDLSRVVRELDGSSASVRAFPRDKLEDGMERLKVLAERWFEDAIAKEERSIDELLEGARGFIDTTQQGRYDECESAINEVLRRIRRIASQWKAVLAKSRYYDALGSVVEAALSRILGDIMALQDITAVESHRLSELCRILNALEGLFVEDPEQPSFVVSYVPSWLKFSYLSELLEASIADISYLFEEGALVDFEIEELAKVVRALFADTPLRANTINRLMQGHPVRG